MLTGHIRKMQQTDSRKVRVLYENPNKWNEVFDHNPRIAQRGEIGDFHSVHARVDGLRPYATSKSPDRWGWREYAPERGELYFTEAEKAVALRHPPTVIIEPFIKNKASPNKDWGLGRWERLVAMMLDAGIRPAQMGPAGTRPLTGVDFILTKTFREAAAVVARARAVVVLEGGLHHAAAAVGTPAVVIYGGFISPRVTGYAEQVSLFTGDDLGCGMRVRCPHCLAAMSRITPEQVFAELEKLLKNEPALLAS